MATVKFPKDELTKSDEIELPWDIDPKRGKIISDETIDTSRRWEDTQELIFELDGKTYRTFYDRGKTEYQETSPWEYETEISCEEVELQEVTIKKWVAVK